MKSEESRERKKSLLGGVENCLETEEKTCRRERADYREVWEEEETLENFIHFINKINNPRMKVPFQRKKIQKKSLCSPKTHPKPSLAPSKPLNSTQLPAEKKIQQTPHEFLNQKIMELLQEKISYFNLSEIE